MWSHIVQCNGLFIVFFGFCFDVCFVTVELVMPIIIRVGGIVSGLVGKLEDQAARFLTSRNTGVPASRCEAYLSCSVHVGLDTVKHKGGVWKDPSNMQLSSVLKKVLHTSVKLEKELSSKHV